MLMLLAILASQTAQEPQKRGNVPDVPAQREAEKLIRDVFKDDYAKKLPADRISLAKKLLTQGIQTADDPASQFVLLREARDVAGAAGDVDTALKAVDETVKRFELDGTSLKAALYGTWAKSLKTPEEAVVLARSYMKLADQAIESDQLDTAEKAAIEASALAKRAKEVSLVTKAEAKRREIGERKGRFDKVRKAREELQKSPDDPAANLSVGEYECFIKGDWAKGLPPLAKGSNPALKTLAERDLADPKDGAGQALAGDGWWDLAEKEKDAARVNVRARALHWYQQAAPVATGLMKTKLDKRLSDLQLDRFRGVWVDLTDPRQFKLAGKAGDPIILAAAPSNPKTATFEKFPPGDFDGVSVRVHFGTPRGALGMICFEGVRRSLYIATGSSRAFVCHVEGQDYVPDKTLDVVQKDDYLLTVILEDGEYVLSIDGKEVERVKTSFVRLLGITLQADHGTATFDQFRLRKKE